LHIGYFIFSWGTVMRISHATVCSIAGLMFAHSALAADMAVKAPPPPPAPIYSWTGWYGGFNIGGTWGDDPISVSTTNLGFCPIGICSGGAATAAASAQGTSGVFSGGTSGVIGGGQFGYNWQFNSSVVAGFEADIQGIGANKATSLNSANFGLVGFPGVSVTTNLSVSKEVDWLGTLRGRLGWVAAPSLLVYGTGGLAYGGVKTNTNVTSSLIGFGPGVLLNPSTTSGTSQTRTGWTAGGGFEWMWTRQWSVKLEYLYYDLGRVTNNALLVDPLFGFAVPNYFVNNVQTSTRFNGNIVRVGVNYQFH
jgi:outer membrane immunogenic protein